MNITLKSELHKLFETSKFHKIPKGQVFQFTSESMFFHLVSKGYVKRYLITDEGTESIQIIYGPNDIFPLTPVFSALVNLNIYKGSETLYYEAMTDVELYSLSKQALQDACNSQPLLYKDLFSVAGERLSSNIYRLENASLKTTENRVVDLLLHYTGRFGRHTHAGIELDIPLTHQTIANSLNVTRETVSLTMSHLHESGLVYNNGHHHLLITDIAALRLKR